MENNKWRWDQLQACILYALQHITHTHNGEVSVQLENLLVVGWFPHMDFDIDLCL